MPAVYPATEKQRIAVDYTVHYTVITVDGVSESVMLQPSRLRTMVRNRDNLTVRACASDREDECVEAST